MNLPVFTAKQLKALLIIGMFLASVFGWISIHSSYELPFHSEEWDHLLLAKELSEEKIAIGSNWEIGFHILIRGLHEFTGLNYEQIALFLPIFVTFLAALGAFILVRFLTKKIIPALFSAILVIGLKSSLTLMGFWFFVPMAIGIAILPMLIYFIIKAFNSAKFAIIFAIVFVQTTIFHPAYTIILIPATVLYFLLVPKVFEKNQFKIVIGIILLLLLLPFFAFQLGFVSGELELSFEGYKQIVTSLISTLTWEKIFVFEAKFSFSEFLGIIPFILGILGFSSIIVLKILSIKNPNHQIIQQFFKNHHLFFLPVMLAILLLLYLQFNLTNKIFLAPYERQFMAAGILLLILAGIALHYAIELIKNGLSQIEGFSIKTFNLILLGLISVFLLSIITISNFEFQPELYENVSKPDLAAIKWVKNFNPEKQYVLALPWHSRIIKQISEKKIYATSNARAAEGIAENLLDFFLDECKIKESFILEQGFDLMISPSEQTCANWNKIYDKSDLSSYSIN